MPDNVFLMKFLFARKKKLFQGQNNKEIMQDKQIWFIKVRWLSSSLHISCVKLTNPFVNKMTFPERIHKFLWIVSHDISCLIRVVLHSTYDSALKIQHKINKTSSLLFSFLFYIEISLQIKKKCVASKSFYLSHVDHIITYIKFM